MLFKVNSKITFMLVIVAIAVSLGASKSIFSSSKKLRDSQNLNLRQLLAARVIENRVHGSDEIAFEPSVITALFVREDKEKTREKRGVSQARVPQPSIDSNLHNTSICPWTFRVDRDENRRPVELIEAVCGSTRINGSFTFCQHIYTYIAVEVNMTSSDGSVTWENKLIKKAVGCTLARAPNPGQAKTIDNNNNGSID